MTDLEFDVLDELYFLTSYHDLQKNCDLTTIQLKEVLQSLFSHGWIKCFNNKEEELNNQDVDFENCFEQYFYLASKSGLFAHNSKV